MLFRSTVSGVLIALAAVFGARALVSWIAEAAAYRTSAKAKAELRAEAMTHVLRLGPLGPARLDFPTAPIAGASPSPCRSIARA